MRPALRSRLWPLHTHRCRWLVAGVAVVEVASAVDLPRAYLASSHLHQERAGLSLTWARDQLSGVTAAALIKLL